MALTFGTVVEASTASGTTNAASMGTLATDDVVVMVASINQTADEDIFTSWAQTAGTATISSVTEIVASQGPNMYLSVGICRVTAGGTLTMTGTLASARRWIIGCFKVTGVPNSLAVADIINASIGSAAGTGTTPITTPGVTAETIGDVAIGVGAWEGLRTATVTTSPASWTEMQDSTIGGAGGDTADASIYIERYTTTALDTLQSAPTVSSSADLRTAMFILRSATPPTTPRRWLTLLGVG